MLEKRPKTALNVVFFVLFLAILAFLAVLQIVLCVTPPVEFCVLEWPLSHDMPSLFHGLNYINFVKKTIFKCFVDLYYSVL